MTMQAPQRLNQNKQNNRAERRAAPRDSESRIAELEALQRIGRALNSTLDERQILRLLIEETVAITPATHGSVFLHDPQQNRRRPQAWYGYTPRQVQGLNDIAQSTRRGIINKVFDLGEIVVTDDVRHDPDYVEVVAQTRSELTVPIRYGPDVVGVIDLESNNLNAFGPDTQRFVLAIAEQAGIAIGNARRYAEQVEQENIASQQSEQLRNLLTISRMLRSEHTLDDLLDLVVQSIPETIGFNVALLSLLQGDPPMLHRVAAAGIPLTDLAALQQVQQPWEAVDRLLQPEYRISESYFFPHQKQAEWDDEYTHTVLQEPENWQEGDWHPRDMLLVPLKGSAGELLGLLSVDAPQDGRVPGLKTVQALELYAHEVSLAIENARLLQDTQQHIEELDLLRQVGLQVASSLNLTTVLETIVASALQLVPASDVRIYLYDQESGQFDCGTQKSRGDHFSRPMAPPRTDGLTAQVVKRGQTLVINDAQHHDLYTRPESSHWGMKATAGLPLKRAGEILGVMDVSFFYEHIFTKKELDLLGLLANQAAVAIDNARLYEHAKKRAMHLEALWHVNQQLASILDFDELLSQVVQIIKSYFDYDRVYIYLVDRSHSRLILQTRLDQPGADRIEPQAPAEIPLNDPECIIAWVATHHRPLLLGEGIASPIPSPSPMMQQLNTKAELAVPLQIGDQVAGVLDIHSDQPGALGHPDLSIIQSLSAQLSVAFENARLYDELEQRVQKRTEELAAALRRQAIETDKTRAIVESISDAVIVFDPQGHVTLVNPGATRVLGLSPDHWRNRNLNQPDVPGLSPQGQEMIEAVFQVIDKARRTLNADQDLVNTTFEAAGRVIAASLASVALREQEPRNMVAVFRDITREAQIDRMKSEFIAMAAHELRTPMTAIKGYISLLSSGVAGPVNETQQQFLQTITSNANRLMTLVTDLLDVSRIEDEGLTLHFEPVSLADIVAEAVVALEKQIEGKQQSLSIDVPTHLPEVVADRDRMIQVVTNLLSNAHKYTPQGGKLVVRGKRYDEHLWLDVQDSGIGVSPQDQEHLFTRFFRAENALKTQEGGTGLGLVICQEIIERHGGEIQVESELGQGSTFRIILPLPKTEI